jgi:hypothetical protein
MLYNSVVKDRQLPIQDFRIMEQVQGGWRRFEFDGMEWYVPIYHS